MAKRTPSTKRSDIHPILAYLEYVELDQKDLAVGIDKSPQLICDIIHERATASWDTMREIDRWTDGAVSPNDLVFWNQ